MSKDSVKQLSGHAGARQSISSVASEVCKRIAKWSWTGSINEEAVSCVWLYCCVICYIYIYDV